MVPDPHIQDLIDMAVRLRRELRELREQGSDKPTIEDVEIKLPFARQGHSYTCMPGCAQSLLYHYGIDVLESELTDALDSDKAEGTNYKRAAKYLEKKGLTVRTYQDMSMEALRSEIAKKVPVIVAFQAWGKGKYSDSWVDGHYAIVCGVSRSHVLVMDPSILSNYGYLPIGEFEARWHDEYSEGGRKVRVRHLGLAVEGPAVKFDPYELRPVR